MNPSTTLLGVYCPPCCIFTAKVDGVGVLTFCVRASLGFSYIFHARFSYIFHANTIIAEGS